MFRESILKGPQVLMISYSYYTIAVSKQAYGYRQIGSNPKPYLVSVLVPYLGITLSLLLLTLLN